MCIFRIDVLKLCTFHNVNYEHRYFAPHNHSWLLTADGNVPNAWDRLTNRKYACTL